MRMGTRPSRRYAVIGAALAALVALSLALTACGSGGGDPTAAERDFHEVFQEWKSSRAMSDVMTEEAIDGSQQEEFVRKALGGHAVKSATATRWFGTDGKSLEGAIVRLRLKQPMDMHSVEVPAWVTPGPDVTENPPIPLRRRALYTGTGVTELVILMTEPRREVLEIIPHGGSIEPPKLTMPVSPGYKKVGEHPGLQSS
jgi:hypothetical protein